MNIPSSQKQQLADFERNEKVRFDLSDSSLESENPNTKSASNARSGMRGLSKSKK